MECDEVAFHKDKGPWMLLESEKDALAGLGQWSFLLWVHKHKDADHTYRELQD